MPSTELKCVDKGKLKSSHYFLYKLHLFFFHQNVPIFLMRRYLEKCIFVQLDDDAGGKVFGNLQSVGWICFQYSVKGIHSSGCRK